MRKFVFNACLIAFFLNVAMLIFNVATDGGFALIGLNVGSMVLCYMGMESNK